MMDICGSSMYADVKLNEYGFYTLKNLPSAEEIEKYYREKYYQETRSAYELVYTKGELAFLNAKLEQKLLLIEEHCPTNRGSLLDIGCGEGFALNFFKNMGFSVLGLDYSHVNLT